MLSAIWMKLGTRQGSVLKRFHTQARRAVRANKEFFVCQFLLVIPEH